MVVEIHDEEKDTDNPERSGGAVMDWNYKELAATLRAQMSSSHPPVVVLKNETDDTERNTHNNN